MASVKNRLQKFKITHLKAAGILCLILLAGVQLWFNNTNTRQAMGAVAAQVRFQGEYRIGDGGWQPIEEGVHIPATSGDVTMLGNFHLYSPGGEYLGLFSWDTPLAFYANHISLTFRVGKNPPYIIDHENPLIGVSACGEDWASLSFSGDSTEPVEIIVHNPHRFGNEGAIDKMLANIAIRGTLDFDRDILASGQTQRNTGFFFIILLRNAVEVILLTFNGSALERIIAELEADTL